MRYIVAGAVIVVVFIISYFWSEVEVKHRDVMPYARRNCRFCYGKGYSVRLEGLRRKEVICHCGLPQFVRHRKEILKQEPSTGQWFWKSRLQKLLRKKL